jgi:hypothetical protein
VSVESDGQVDDGFWGYKSCLWQFKHRMSSLIATVTTYVCSVCDKAFGSNYASCAKHTACGKYNRCRDQGATVLPLTNTVGRHDRHVGGRQAQAPRPPQPDSDVNEADEGAGGDEPADEPEDEPETGPQETGCYPIISKSYPNKYPFITLHIL